MSSAADWGGFLSAEAAAAAALAGLVFVAVSINLPKILQYEGVSGRAAEALILLVGVLAACTVALAPHQTDPVLGFEVLVIGVSVWLCTSTLHVRSLGMRGRPWWWLATRVALCQIATLPFVVAGASLILGSRGAMYWFIPGCIFSFVAGMVSAWVLLVEILR